MPSHEPSNQPVAPGEFRDALQHDAAGYVARAREWGLLEPKLAEGRYLRRWVAARIAWMDRALPARARRDR